MKPGLRVQTLFVSTIVTVFLTACPQTQELDGGLSPDGGALPTDGGALPVDGGIGPTPSSSTYAYLCGSTDGLVRLDLDAQESGTTLLTENECKFVATAPNGSWLVWTEENTVWIQDPAGEREGFAAPSADAFNGVSINNTGTVSLRVGGDEVWHQVQNISGWTSVFDSTYFLVDSAIDDNHSWYLENSSYVDGSEFLSHYSISGGDNGQFQLADGVDPADDFRRYLIASNAQELFVFSSPAADADWTVQKLGEDDDFGDYLLESPLGTITLDTVQGLEIAFSATATHLYWPGLINGQRQIWKMSTSGGTPELVFDGNTSVDGDISFTSFAVVEASN